MLTTARWPVWFLELALARRFAQFPCVIPAQAGIRQAMALAVGRQWTGSRFGVYRAPAFAGVTAVEVARPCPTLRYAAAPLRDRFGDPMPTHRTAIGFRG